MFELTAVGKMATSVAGKLLELNNLIQDAKVKNAVIEITTKVLELQQKLSEAQGDYDKLMQEKRGLEDKLVAKQKWEDVAQRYQLKKIDGGMFLYELSMQYAGSQPPHYLCPNCFNKQTKSIMQVKNKGSGVLSCHECNLELDFGDDSDSIGFLGC